MEGSGAEQVRLRLCTGAFGPLWQVPEQGPQGPQAAQAPCAVRGEVGGVQMWSCALKSSHLAVPSFNPQTHSGYLH